MTPSAAYRAPVSSAAVSTSFCSSASSESSELSAMPASTSPRSRSRVASHASVAMPTIIARRDVPGRGLAGLPGAAA